MFPSFRSSNKVSSSSVESNNLSTTLSSQCYLYFSIGSRLTHLGFSHARSALSQQPSTTIRAQLTNSASLYLQQAASHWHNPILISGRVDESSTKENSVNYEEMAINAHEAGSPLARAAYVLMELGDVVGLVNVCLICAGNFGGVQTERKSSDFKSDKRSGSMIAWERGLYHQPTDETNSLLMDSTTTAMVMGNSDSDKRKLDAKHTCHAVLFYYLSFLLKSTSDYEQNIAAEKMLSIATASPDINFLKELYGYLASSGHVDTLLKIESPSVESWLENINKDHDLLWRYYVIHGMHWLAAEFMWKLGLGSEEKLRLEERIQYLNRAANSYSDAILNPPHHSMMERNELVPSREEMSRFIEHIREQVDVAKLQSRILAAIISSKNASQIKEDRLDILSFTLVNVSELYNNYAAELGLYDLCLSIIQTCNYNDASTIRTLWRSIFCEELLPCRTCSKEVQLFINTLQRGSMLEEERIILSDADVANDEGESLMLFEDGKWIASIKHRIISLGKELQGKGADFAFPVDFITEQLEGKFIVDIFMITRLRNFFSLL